MEYLRNWSLQMFGEGGEGASAPTGGNEGTNEGGAPAQEKLSFDDLLKDEDYQKEFEKRVSRRSGYEVRKAAREERAKLAPMYQALARKYGMDVSDPAKIDLNALSEKVLGDDDLLEQRAAEMGVTVEGARKILNAEQQLQEAERIRQEEADAREWREIERQAEALRQIYPGFDLGAEMENPQFGLLLRNNMRVGVENAVQNAFQTVHMGEIMSGAMQYAAQKTRQQVSNSIQAGANRPAENGAASAAAQSHIDPSKFTRKDIEDIRKRVNSGEHITFR